MIIFVGIGGTLGAISRFLLGRWISDRTKTHFPWGTWFINLSGSLLLGFLAYLNVHGLIPQWLWLFIGVGYLGAYTTFSTFGYETIQLLEKKNYKAASLYVISSVFLGVIFAGIGSMLGKFI
jgi:fluoride exporter